MLTPWLILALQAGAALPDAPLAYLTGPDPDERTVVVFNPVTEARRVVGNGRRDCPPAWSPDGRWIAYSTQGESSGEMRIVRPDGSESKTVSHTYEGNISPSWSDDGRYLAYAGGGGLLKHIMVYDMETGTESQWGGTRSGLLEPRWLSRNDLLLLLTAEEDSEWLQQLIPPGEDAREVPILLSMAIVGLPGTFTTDIQIVTPYGSVPLPQTVLPSEEARAEWAVAPAPDGKAIAFESNDGGDREIFVLSKRGAADVSNHHAADWNPSWSPDGRWLLFESFRDGRRGIYRVSRDSVRVIPVAVDERSDCWDATWSPDGAWIAYVSDRTGNCDLFATHLDSGETIQLTDAPDDDLAPAWGPVEEDER